jgi:hypothetical protein
MIPAHGGKLQDDTPGTNMMDVGECSACQRFDVDLFILTLINSIYILFQPELIFAHLLAHPYYSLGEPLPRLISRPAYLRHQHP